MNRTATTYLGLQLRNPIVVGSSQLTGSTKKVEACDRAGAGAVVLKSVFEVQIRSDAKELTSGVKTSANNDVSDVVESIGTAYALEEYLSFISDAKRGTGIPIIASLHCTTPRAWPEYARKIERAGADAIELNLSELPVDAMKPAREIEREHVAAVRSVRGAVKLPIAVKIGPHYSSLGETAAAFRSQGASAVVLFNRFYRPDINVEHVRLQQTSLFSAEEEATLPLRWISLLAGRVDVDLVASTGIYSAETVIKQLLAGARCVQMCSALYRRGLELIPTVLEEIDSWMQRRKFSSLSEFRGLLSAGRGGSAESFTKTQFAETSTGVR